MRALHDVPIITPELVTLRPPVGLPILHDALRDGFERVKATLEPVSIEDLSKLWTALTLPYRVGAVYCVSVVQIESRRRRSFPQRVKEPPAGPRIQVVPFRYPQIREVAVLWQDPPPDGEQPYPYVRIGDRLVIKGDNFRSANTRLRLGRLEVPLGVTDDRRLEVGYAGQPIRPGRSRDPAGRVCAGVGAHTRAAARVWR